jgi:hypothetical protein
VGFEVARHYGFRAKGPTICIAQAEGLGNLSIRRKSVWNITTRSVSFEVARYYGFRAKGPTFCIAQAEGLGNETKQIP